MRELFIEELGEVEGGTVTPPASTLRPGEGAGDLPGGGASTLRVGEEGGGPIGPSTFNAAEGAAGPPGGIPGGQIGGSLWPGPKK